jgi:hypothetical protein
LPGVFTGEPLVPVFFGGSKFEFKTGETQMIKKVLFVLVLAVQVAVVCSAGAPENPIPQCLPCPGE